MPYHIRKTESADIPAILSLYAQPDMDNGRGMDLETANAVFGGISNYPNYRTFVACADNQIVGIYALVILDNLAHMGALSALVHDVAVLADWHRKGGRQGYADPCHGAVSKSEPVTNWRRRAIWQEILPISSMNH